MSAHYVETYIDDEVADRSRRWGWQCFTCGYEDDGFSTQPEAEKAGEHHRVEEATQQQMIDDGELP